MNSTWFIELMRQFNEIITAATVIVSASMLLYNLTRNLHDRVTRASSVLLAAVTIIYVGDVLIALSRMPSTIEALLRFEWIGLSLAPAALFHLSDALLSTTGLISRGRRRRIVRILYGYAAIMIVAAVVTDLIVHDLLLQPMPMMQAGPMVWVYALYFIGAAVFAFMNVWRASQRCLTAATRRRMRYLLVALITPVVGIFPYSVLFHQPTAETTLPLWILINIGNLAIVLMLIFMAYPLSFFGPKKPARVLKAELLSFMLRGPVLGVIILMVMQFVPRLRFSGILGTALLPFVVVSVTLFLQWLYTWLIPKLENKLIYSDEQSGALQLGELNERLLSPSDSRQLLEAMLASICDYLRVPSAFIAQVNDAGFQLEQHIGTLLPNLTSLGEVGLLEAATNDATNYHLTMLNPEGNPDLVSTYRLIPWQSFWLIPLYSTRNGGRTAGPNGTPALIGILGIWARSPQPNLHTEEQDALLRLTKQAAVVLEDMRLQTEVLNRLQYVMQETANVEAMPDNLLRGFKTSDSSANVIVQSPDFVNLVREALRDYWGGPNLTNERMLKLRSVIKALHENEGNPARAVRAVLNSAIERLRPEGARQMTMPEWTLYNILELRFVQGKRVRDVAPQLAMSDADLYRKQKIAIERIADEIRKMETPEDAEPVAEQPSGEALLSH